jgi:hypothetical protein
MTTTSVTSPSVPKHRKLWRALIVAGVLLIVANLGIVLLMNADTGVQSQTGLLPSAVQSISPVPGSTVRPQDTVSVDLRDGLVGDLYIDGRVIPVDQTEAIPALGIVRFRPGANKEFEAFTPGQHEVTVRWRDQRSPVDMVEGEHTWTFAVA